MIQDAGSTSTRSPRGIQLIILLQNWTRWERPTIWCKFYIKDGKKISHSINPKTGHPVEHNLLSATVVAENATVADGYATYLMVLGLDKAREVVTSREGIEALLIYSQGDSLKVWMSDGMDAIVE